LRGYSTKFIEFHIHAVQTSKLIDATVGTGVAFSSNLACLAVSLSGDIYILDTGNDAIITVDPKQGNRSIVADTDTIDGLLFVQPALIAVDPDGTLLVSDDGNGRLYRINPENDERTPIDHSLLLPNIEGIALIDGDSVVISSRTVGAPGKWRIAACDRYGGVCSTICDESNGNGPEPIDYIASICAEPEGAIIGLDWHRNRRTVMRIDPESGDRVIISKGPGR
jgi:streptogramin lyase